jgi:ubiquinone/menaquinone biosynthesis C-methylase UbiE
MKLNFICPNDHNVLEFYENYYKCNICNNIYQSKNNIFSTLEMENEFYEGAYVNKILYTPKNNYFWNILPLWVINGGYLWAVKKYIKKKSTIVELGCAGGVTYFGKNYNMIGCDLSHTSLILANEYNQLIQCDATQCIPLPDNTVDAVISSYFWEHVTKEQKNDILKEANRILKPNGHLIFLYDVETSNPFIKYFKKKSSYLYKKLFLDKDGHIGYHLPEDNINLFKDSGFNIVKHRGLEKTFIQSPSVYIKLVEYNTNFKKFYLLLSKLGQSPYVYIYSTFTRLIDTIICPLLPKSWARIDIIICKKK